MSDALGYTGRMTRAEALEKIAEIELILDGPQTVTIGDRTVSYDFAHLRRRLAQYYSFVRGNNGQVRVGRYNRSYTG